MNGTNAGAMFVWAFLLASSGCNQTTTTALQHKESKPSDSRAELPSFATVIVDFSASFAPLTQTDRLALKETARALTDLAIQDWTPPTTIVWRKIGTASATPAPLCDVLEFNRSIIGAVTTAERLRTQLEACTETVVRASRVPGTPEPYTDIGGGIMMAAQNWAAMDGRKALIILSDFLEDLPKGTHVTPVQLHGESVLLLHRPGTTETADLTAYLDRITAWKNRLRDAGAHSVATLPTFRATLYTIEQALAQQAGAGTSISIVTDLVSPMPDQQAINRAITVISTALAKRAAEWPAPVTAGWFATARPAWRTVAVAPVVYTPRLARKSNELNTADAFEKATEEIGLALQQRHDVGNGDIDGALRLISNGETATASYLVVLSNFEDQAPVGTGRSLRGERVLMVYRARDAIDGAHFFERVNKWQEYFKSTGAVQVCALDITTLTDSAISTCLQR
jgi:hypothetical protein